MARSGRDGGGSSLDPGNSLEQPQEGIPVEGAREGCSATPSAHQMLLSNLNQGAAMGSDLSKAVQHVPLTQMLPQPLSRLAQCP